MGQRIFNPLNFTTALPNQLDPVLNPVRPPRTSANNSTEGLAGEDTIRGSRDDQAFINNMDNAVGGLQPEETRVEGQRTQLNPSDLQQQTGQRGAAQRLDILA